VTFNHGADVISEVLLSKLGKLYKHFNYNECIQSNRNRGMLH